MLKSKNSLQNFFLSILAITVSFNASINPIMTQISSIGFVFVLILCLRNYEIVETIKINYKSNLIFFYFFLIYIIFLIFQIVPLPLDLIKIIAPSNYDLYSSLKINKQSWSISLDVSSSYFNILSCISYFIIFLIFPVLFNRKKYLMKFFFFLCILGFCHAVFATYWMLIGNPTNFLIEKIHYLNASTGLFVNRSVFATFLFLCSYSGLFYIIIYFQKYQITNFTFFEQLKSKIFFIRIFIIFLSIGILTTWSRIVNLSYILILLSFLFYSKIYFKKIINPLSSIIIIILIFDVMVMAIFFGDAKLIERVVETTILGEAKRFELQTFGWDQFKKFWLFGYGSGAFGQIFKTSFIMTEDLNYNFIVNHVHNDGIELLGEIGTIGALIFSILTIIYLKKLINDFVSYRRISNIVILFLLLILFLQSQVDFSLHITGISVLLMTILSIGMINFRNQ